MEIGDIEEFLKKQREILEVDKKRLILSESTENLSSEKRSDDLKNGSSSQINREKDLIPSKSIEKERKIIDNIISKNNEKTPSSYNTIKDSKNSVNENKLKKSKKKDNEEWISDKFFQYFPSFNDNERKKRETLMQSRMYDYQKYLQINSPTITSSSDVNKTMAMNTATARSDNSNKMNMKNDKTEIEIIVNNPDFKLTNKNKPSSKIPRPSTTRDKLLHDLMHTELSNMVNSNAIQERNRQTAEEEAQNKKEYCKELMKQIEEKRQEVKILKEKEQREEELLTKKQLQSVRNEKNELLQEKTYENSNHIENYYTERQIKSENGDHSKNKVYKYFSNSARYDSYHNRICNREKEQFSNDTRTYNSEPPLSHRLTNTEFLMDANGNDNPHYNDENGTPFSLSSSCNATVNEIVCLNCDRHHYSQHNQQQQQQRQQHHNQGIQFNEIGNSSNANFHYQYLLTENMKLKEFLSRILCLECEKLCTKCGRCNQKRSLCSNCVQNYCINCGKSLKNTGAAGYNVCMNTPTTTVTSNLNTSPRINSSKPEIKLNDKSNKIQNTPRNTATEKSFQILEISYSPDFRKDDKVKNIDNNDFDDDDNDVLISKDNEIHNDKSKRNSSYNMADDVVLDKKIIDNDIEDIKKKTNSQLAKYLNNYGDLAYLNSYRRRSGSVGNNSSRISNENTPRSRKQ